MPRPAPPTPAQYLAANLPTLTRPFTPPFWVGFCCHRVAVSVAEPLGCGTCNSSPRRVRITELPASWEAVVQTLL